MEKEPIPEQRQKPRYYLSLSAISLDLLNGTLHEYYEHSEAGRREVSEFLLKRAYQEAEQMKEYQVKFIKIDSGRTYKNPRSYVNTTLEGMSKLAELTRAARATRKITLREFEGLTNVAHGVLRRIENEDTIGLELKTLENLHSYTPYSLEELISIVEGRYRSIEQSVHEDVEQHSMKDKMQTEQPPAENSVKQPKIKDTANSLDEISASEEFAKYFYSSLKGSLFTSIRTWCQGKGRIKLDWAVLLDRNGQNWISTPALTYVSYERLPRQWRRNAVCPVPCTLAIEIIPLGESWRYRKGNDTFALNG